VLVNYSCVKSGYPGEGNIDDDPMFEIVSLGEPSWYQYFYLQPHSPCIDAGSRTAEEAGLSDWTTQTDGTPDTGRVDMGAHYPLP